MPRDKSWRNLRFYICAPFKRLKWIRLMQIYWLCCEQVKKKYLLARDIAKHKSRWATFISIRYETETAKQLLVNVGQLLQPESKIYKPKSSHFKYIHYLCSIQLYLLPRVIEMYYMINRRCNDNLHRDRTKPNISVTDACLCREKLLHQSIANEAWTAGFMPICRYATDWKRT